jgi:hypothetical protein
MQLELQKQILLTLSYSQVFFKPLSAEEIALRLMYSNNFKNAYSPTEISRAIFSLSDKKLLVEHGGYWQLTTTKNDLSVLRKKREQLSNLKIKELQLFLSFVKTITWIEGVAITGSVSVKNAEAKDDVDLMIIVQAGRLWLVRPILVLFSFLCGKRRSWNHEEYNSWCLNLWLEVNSLAVHPDKRSIYTAYEVCQALWVLDRNGTNNKFLKANEWVEQYLPVYFSNLVQRKNLKLSSSHRVDSQGFWSAVNDQAYLLQRWYMKRHMTTERVGKSFAFFHPRNTKRNIFQAWKKSISALI